MRELPVLKIDLKKPQTFGNLAEKLDQSARRTLATDLMELIGIDDQSMTEWAGKAQGFLDKAEKDGNPHPQNREQDGAGEEAPPATEMTLSAVIQFSARATDALLGEPDLARASETGGEALAAWVSSQLRTKDKNWILDTDPLVMHMAVTGLAWRKRDFDDDERVFHSHFIPSVGGNRVIVNANVRSIERAPRITHEFERYPYEIERSISRGKWVDYEPIYDEADPQAPKRFFECDAWLDVDGDEIDEPWTVTISRDDHAEVVRIRPRWSAKTVVDNDSELFFNPIRRFYPYRMLPDPKGGFFPIGFGKLLDRIEDAADNLLGSITDTAKTEAQNGGVLGGSSFALPDSVELKGNRLTSVPTDGQPIDKVMQMFPSKSVSAGSVQMLDKLMTFGDRLAGTLNLMENAPASMTATLAKGIMDSGQQVQSAVHRRMVASLTQEMIMFVQMADAYDMLPEGISASDSGGIAVTADPQLATEMQRTAMAGIYMEIINSESPVWNRQEAAQRFGQVMRLPNPEKLISPPQQPQATPWEKMQGAVHLMKLKVEQMKVTGAVAVQLTQALLNMVEAAGGMQNNRMALLTMAQLEQAVQQMMDSAGSASDAGRDLDGMAGQSGNAAPPGLPAPPQGVGGPDLSSGAAGGPGDAGAGGSA